MMAVAFAQRRPQWTLVDPDVCPGVNAPATAPGRKDDARYGSEDSTLSIEECNVAKAARIEGPARPVWGGHTVTSLSAAPEAGPAPWTPADADAFYNVSGWSEGYFRVGDNGLLCVSPAAGEFSEATPQAAPAPHRPQALQTLLDPPPSLPCSQVAARAWT